MGYLAAIANHLWQSTLFAGVMWILARILKKNAASVRYAVWMAASVKFLVPFAFLISVGSHFAWKAEPQIVQAPAAAVMEEIGQPFAMSDVAVKPTPDLATSVGALAESGLKASRTISLRDRVTERLPQILLGLWLCGVVVSLGFWVRWVSRMRQLRKSGTAMDMGTPIQVLSSPIQMEPCVFGVFHPVLMLPEGITERLTAAEMEAVMAHELSHVQRRDNLTAAVHFFIETAFWFWPVLRWVRTKLIEERERACDEAVLRVVAEPSVYAEGILKVCRLYLATQPEVAAGVSGSNLKRRIEVIVNYRESLRLSIVQKVGLAVVAAMVVYVPVVFGQMRSIQSVSALTETIRPIERILSPALAPSGNLLVKEESNQATPLAKDTAPVDGTVLRWDLLSGIDINVPRNRQPAELLDLSGKQVTILGFMVPLQGEGGKVDDFMLVPYADKPFTAPRVAIKPFLYVKLKDVYTVYPNEPIVVSGKFSVNTVISPYGNVNVNVVDATERLYLGADDPLSKELMKAAPVSAQQETVKKSDDVVDITGTWQGTISSLTNFRVALRVEKNGAGWSGLLYRPGTPGTKSVEIPKIQLQGDSVHFEIPSMDNRFEGKLGEHGNSIAGSWIGGEKPELLTLTRATVETAWDTPQAQMLVRPMLSRDPSFEVATIKPSAPQPPYARPSAMYNGRKFTTRGTSVKYLLEFAYGVNDKQLMSGPDWLDKDKYDIAASVAEGEGTPNVEQWKVMLRKLLAERFQLKFHEENRELSVYALTVAKGGPKLTKSSTVGTFMSPGMGFALRPNGLNADGRNLTMGDFAEVLRRNVLDRPVVDHTGLTGHYDIQFLFAAQPGQMGSWQPPPVNGEPAEDLFSALQNQLGLKIDITKAVVDVIVMDKLEHPSEN